MLILESISSVKLETETAATEALRLADYLHRVSHTKQQTMEDRPTTQEKKTDNKHDKTEAIAVNSGMTSSPADGDHKTEAAIQSLPPELLVEILSMLSVHDVVAFGSTCHAFHHLTLIHWTWRRLFRRQSRDWRLRNINIILKALKTFTTKEDTEKE